MIGKIQDAIPAAVVIGAVDTASKMANTDDSNAQAAALTADGSNVQARSTQPQNGVAAADETQTSAKDQQDKDKQKKGKMDEKAVSQMTKELNKLMSKINCDLEFQSHKEVNVMSVKMVDKTTQEVIKEYPPEDMIKGMIKAREWIGAFLDKNA